LIPTPYERDKSIEIDYGHSYVWEEEGELLGYMLVYSDAEKTKFHIYKQVTSPFGRGKGIGSAFMEKLAYDVAADAYIYLYVWEKLISSIDFFLSKGLDFEGSIVYRKMKFYLMSARVQTIRDKAEQAKTRDFSAVDELTKVRHDAKKSLRVLFDMASMLHVDNFNKVVEDINRETTALLNTLNMYEDKIMTLHEVDIQELITDRVIPVIEVSNVPCEIRLILGSKIPHVTGSYLNFSRALINLVSNSLDAVRESGRRGIIEIKLTERDDSVVLSIQDNGIGIEESRLKTGDDMIPLFVGITTKQGKTGEGVGTRQIFSTFGPNNILVESKAGEFTRWTISLKKITRKDAVVLAGLESRYTGFIKSTEHIAITEKSPRMQVAAFIWQLREMEIFSYDLVYLFSRYNNVRDIYRSILLYRNDKKDLQYLKTELEKCRIDSEVIKSWLLGIVRRIKRNETFISQHFDFEEYKGVLFKSYGQATGSTIIFTMDPETGRFYSTDRKLAEHMDFVPYLSAKRDHLLRGEFFGDVRKAENPMVLGVWSVATVQDLRDRLVLVRKGAQQFLEMGLKEDKRLSFYQTTFNTCDCEIDTAKTTTLGEMAALKDDELDRFIVTSESEMGGLVFAD
jgi:two-component sensor histidine kinase/predicted GNAT family acetyltransferase